MMLRTGLWLICTFATLLTMAIAITVCALLTPFIIRAAAACTVGALKIFVFLGAWLITWLIALTASAFVMQRVALLVGSEVATRLILGDVIIITPLIAYLGVRRAMKRIGYNTWVR